MSLKQIPNIITVMRIILIAPFLYAMLNDQYSMAFYIFLVAGLSDGIDGFLARHFQWTTQFGVFMDPLADKLLMMSSFIVLAWFGKLPLWLFVIVILRDVVIMSGIAGIFYVRGNVDFEPSMISKINTGLQVLLIGLLLFELAFHAVAAYLLEGVMYCVAVMTLLSLMGYVWDGLRQAFFSNDRHG